MATVQHSALTGASLHEPKGTAAAAASRVYLSDGAGSGSWAQVPLAALANTAKSFEAQLLHVREEQASANSSTPASSSTHNTRVLNTVKTNEITSASLASNQITLPAGTYWAEAFAPFIGQVASTNNADWGSRLELYNVTDASYTLIGQSNWSAQYNSGLTAGNSATTYHGVIDCVRGRFTIAGTKVFELRHWMRLTGGGAMYSGFTTGNTTEIYGEIYLWKIA